MQYFHTVPTVFQRYCYLLLKSYSRHVSIWLKLVFQAQWMLSVDVGHTFITTSSVWRQRGELSAEKTLHVSPLSLIYNSSPQATYDLRGTIHLTSNTQRNPSTVCVWIPDWQRNAKRVSKAGWINYKWLPFQSGDRRAVILCFWE